MLEKEKVLFTAISPFPTMFSNGYFIRVIKGGYLDFSHLTELKNIYITEIYMRKQYKTSKFKNKKITFFFL